MQTRIDTQIERQFVTQIRRDNLRPQFRARRSRAKDLQRSEEEITHTHTLSLSLSLSLSLALQLTTGDVAVTGTTGDHAHAPLLIPFLALSKF
jgi:hypothetical protein